MGRKRDEKVAIIKLRNKSNRTLWPLISVITGRGRTLAPSDVWGSLCNFMAKDKWTSALQAVGCQVLLDNLLKRAGRARAPNRGIINGAKERSLASPCKFYVLFGFSGSG